MHATALAIATLLVAAPAWAQPPQPTADSARAPGFDARWQPWLGCWELVTESVPIVGSAGPARRQPALPGTRVCVAPSETPGGVTLTTWIADQKVLDDTIVADGVDRPAADDECKGTQQTAWSASGRRLFTNAAITCADQTPRKVSSLGLLTADSTWIDIQVIDIAGRKNVRVRRYERVDDPRADPAATPLGARLAERPPADAVFTLDDVMETSARLPPEAVQAALVELDASYDLTSRKLIALDDAGVAGRVIDLMVALSYPEKFVVDRPRSSGPSGGLSAGSLWPWLYDATFWSSYYSPFAYRYWGYYDPFGYPSSGFIVLAPGTPGDGEPATRGRVVKDFGYTQVRPRPAEPTITAAGGRGTSSTAGTSGGSSGSSGSGTSGVSGQGYTSGGAGGGTRTAQPRPPGGR